MRAIHMLWFSLIEPGKVWNEQVQVVRSVLVLLHVCTNRGLLGGIS